MLYVLYYVHIVAPDQFTRPQQDHDTDAHTHIGT